MAPSHMTHQWQARIRTESFRRSFRVDLREILESLTARAHFDPMPLKGSIQLHRWSGKPMGWYHHVSILGQRRQLYVGQDSPLVQREVTVLRSMKLAYRERAAIVQRLRKSKLGYLDLRVGQLTFALASYLPDWENCTLHSIHALEPACLMNGYRIPLKSLRRLHAGHRDPIQVQLSCFDPMLDAYSILKEFDPKSFERIEFDGAIQEVDLVNRAGLQLIRRSLKDRRAHNWLGPDIVKQRKAYAFLFKERQRSIVLYGPGIPIMTPTVERWALHKLLSCYARWPNWQEGLSDDMDLVQAAELLSAVATGNRWSKFGEAVEEMKRFAPEVPRAIGQALYLLRSPEANRLRRFL